MPFSNEISVLPTNSHAPTLAAKSWREKLFDFYTWCKFISLCLNLMYMASGFMHHCWLRTNYHTIHRYERLRIFTMLDRILVSAHAARSLVTYSYKMHM